MLSTERNFLNILFELENWINYENSYKPRDISKLEGIQLLLKLLKNPEKKYKIIHIAGTNGKGSTANIISRLLQVQGFSTGCYTSPHLIDIRERIMLNGRPISKKKFTNSASIVLKIARSFKGNPLISYFDLLTAIALHVFKHEKMEWVILESGLGGRADSTNVTSKELCVLTKIGIDHQDILGNGLKQIAMEKIGITRSEIPIIVANQEDELKTWLIQKLNKNRIPFYFVDKFFEEQFKEIILSNKSFSKSRIENIKTSLCAIHLMFKGNGIQKKKWLESAKKVKIPGRLDLRKKVFWKKHSHYFEKILLDGSHNKDSIIELCNYLKIHELFQFTLILGMASDKLVNSLQIELEKLCLEARNLILTPVDSPRTASTKILENFIFKSNPLKNFNNIVHASSAEEALKTSASYNQKLIVVSGSFFLVGEVLKILKYKSHT